MKQGQRVMGDARAIVQGALAHRFANRIPRGELWLGTELLQKADLEDDLQGHRALIERLGQDCLCLPLAATQSMNKAFGYRYFSVAELAEASRMNDLFLMAVIDGPLQRLVNKKGLMQVLIAWGRERQEVATAYEQERGAVALLLKQCLEIAVDAVIIADDWAGERGLFFAPEDVEAFFAPFYTQAVSEIHKGNAYALFHSCGNIQQVIPHLVAWGIDGLAAIQHRANDLIALKEHYGARLTVMAGIDAELLASEELSLSTVEQYEMLVRSLSRDGGFILCSCTGLYAGAFLERIRELYRIVDAMTTR
jgi:uroporphyrinogen-III decarboxylase